MAKKLLITGGCSFTDANFKTLHSSVDQPAESWVMWPEYLGDKLNLDVLNTAESGSSNEKIFHETMSKIIQYRDRVDTVAILWTEFDRSRFYGIVEWMPIAEARITYEESSDDPRRTGFEWRNDIGLSNVAINFFKSKRFWSIRDDFIKNCIHDSLRYILMMAEYCKAYNIKYIFMQGLNPLQYQVLNNLAQSMPMNTQPNGELPLTYKEDYINHFIKNEWFNNIDRIHEKNMVGWPFEPHLNGYFLDFMRYNGMKPFEKSKEHYFVSDEDLHPNAEAQTLISQIFHERWTKLYG